MGLMEIKIEKNNALKDKVKMLFLFDPEIVVYTLKTKKSAKIECFVPRAPKKNQRCRGVRIIAKNNKVGVLLQ